MARITQHLWFEKDMEAALNCYVALIPGSSVNWFSDLPADTPSGPAGSVKLAGPLDPFNHSFSVMVECDDQAEVDRLWDALSEGGEAEQCGWLRDRWGLCWQIVPRRLTELMNDPDAARVRRVTEAMLLMGKIDIAGLEAAARE